ncbi:MAG: patatin-like phospholipase family protein [Clostridia bacterium]|nr:patatin-like phospholipase family protein [Clostridia bacterium]
MKKLGLALGAGGSRGVAHIGFLKALEEEGIKPDYICGCSMGSVVGAAYASGMSLSDMWAAVGKLRILDIITPSKQRGGLFGTKKIRQLLLKNIGDITFEEMKIPFRCVAVDMCTQSIVVFSEGSVLDAVVASSSIPAVFHPLDKDGMRLVDGGILERVPVKQVKEMGADVVVAVDVLGQKDCSEDCPRTLGVLLEILDLMDNHRTKRRREENADIIDFWLEPDLGSMSQYELKQVGLAYQKGYELGLEYAPAIKKALRSRKRKKTEN